MSKQDKPRFGEWVRFTQHMEKRTYEEYKALYDDGQGVVHAKMVPNPDPGEPASVIGLVSLCVEWHLADDDERRYVAAYGRNRSFYVLRRSIRGKRFLVALEDIIRDGGEAK